MALLSEKSKEILLEAFMNKLKEEIIAKEKLFSPKSLEEAFGKEHEIEEEN